MGQHTNEESAAVTGTVVGVSYGADVQTVQVQGVPVPNSRVVVVEEVGREDYLPACLGTALCGPFGLCATFLCCPTQHGKLGAASGCAWNTLWRVCLFTSALILVALSVISCDQSLAPTDISKSDCDSYGGNFTDGGCYNACPSGFDIRFSEYQNFSQWCEDPDPTCTGMSQSDVIFNIVTSVIIFAIAVHFIRKYSREIEESPQYTSVV